MSRSTLQPVDNALMTTYDRTPNRFLLLPQRSDNHTA